MCSGRDSNSAFPKKSLGSYVLSGYILSPSAGRYISANGTSALLLNFLDEGRGCQGTVSLDTFSILNMLTLIHLRFRSFCVCFNLLLLRY
jgi:hypothetical protein